ncbi:MAG: component of SufBCD complex [Marinibacterium sp.]
MDWYKAIFELIDLRSFSNLWFWIALAVVWSSASHWVLGVPFDMITRARRIGGQAQTDLDDIAHINARRLAYISDVSGLWLLGITCFVLSALVMLGFVYDVEFAQALFLLGLPMTFVGFLSLRVARRIVAQDLRAEGLIKALTRHRTHTQMIGTVAIFVTALWGMYQNLTIGVLG